MKPILSIIIPTHNSESTIQRCIRSLTSQSFPREQFEIIVVDDGSKDKTTTLAKETGADQIIVTEPCFQGKARNIGVQNAKASLLAFIDSDCEAEDGWVKTILKELESFHALAGSVKNGNPHSLIAWAEYFVEFGSFNEFIKRSPAFMMIGCNFACTREAYMKAGCQAESITSEDTLFSQRLKDIGIKPMFIPEMSIKHLCRTKLDKVFSTQKRNGKNYVKIRRTIPTIQHSSLKNSRWLIPVGFIRKFGASLTMAIEAKKFGKFILSFPLVIFTVISYCQGISAEIKNHE